MERAALRPARAEARLDPRADVAARVVVECPLGRLAGEAREGVLRFLGVPYAAAPVGALRPASPWAGTRDATGFAAASPQVLASNQTWLNEPIAQSPPLLARSPRTPRRTRVLARAGRVTHSPRSISTKP